MTPDYVTTFECWSNFPVEVGKVYLSRRVLAILPSLPWQPPGHRWVGQDLRRSA
jgi:hypothetical protein